MATLAAGSSSTSSSSGYDHLSDLGKTLSNTFPGLSPPINYVMVQNRGVGDTESKVVEKNIGTGTSNPKQSVTNLKT